MFQIIQVFHSRTVEQTPTRPVAGASHMPHAVGRHDQQPRRHRRLLGHRFSQQVGLQYDFLL